MNQQKLGNRDQEILKICKSDSLLCKCTMIDPFKSDFDSFFFSRVGLLGLTNEVKLNIPRY